jgi:hypothetical protein
MVGPGATNLKARMPKGSFFFCACSACQLQKASRKAVAVPFHLLLQCLYGLNGCSGTVLPVQYARLYAG